MTVAPNLERFEALRESRVPSRCKVARLLDDLGEQERVDFTHAMRLQNEEGEWEYSTELLGRWFDALDLRVGWQALERHRRDTCCCEH